MSNLPEYLSHSRLSVLRRCGEQYRRKYIEGEPTPGSVATLIGTATHRSAEENLVHRMTTEVPLPLEACKDIANDTYVAGLEQEIHFTEDEKEQGEKKVLGLGRDKAINSAVVHAEKVAPDLNPEFVEKKFQVSLNGYPIDLLAIMDVGDRAPNNELWIRDLKTAKRAPNRNAAILSPQLTFYDLVLNEAGIHADMYALDHVVGGKSYVTTQARRDEEDRKLMLSVIERAIEVIEKGAFVPTDPGNWWCSKSYCWYAPTCPFFAGRKTIGGS